MDDRMKLDTVVVSGDAKKCRTDMVELALWKVACLVEPGEDWRPLLTREAVDDHLTDLEAQHEYRGGERQGETHRGIRFWNLTNAPLHCVPVDPDSPDRLLGKKFSIDPWEPVAGRIEASSCPWSCGQLSNPFAVYRLWIDGSDVEPTDFCVNTDSSQHCMVRMVRHTIVEWAS